MALKEGMTVEVRSNEEGYKGAWVEGIVRTSERGGVCKVNLKKIVRTNVKSLLEVKKSIRTHGQSLVEVSPADVRPIPPHRQWPLHCLNGVAVEAWETDCWWPGFIVREVSCDGRHLWLVSFPHTHILTAYPLSLLRPAQEWREKKWTLLPPENNLNIGQVIRVMSAEEAAKSSNLSDVSQVCSTNKIIEAVNTKEPSSAHYECKENPVPMGPQMSLEQPEIIHLDERNQRDQHCSEVQNAEELRAVEVMGIEDNVQEAKDATEVEDTAEVVQDVQKAAKQEKVLNTYFRRRRKF